MSQNKLSKALYRSLLGACKTFDANPQLKAMLTRPLHAPEGEVQKVFTKTFKEKESIFYRPAVSFTEVLKERFRKHKQSEGEKLDKLHDSSFYLLRTLNTTLAEAKKQKIHPYEEKQTESSTTTSQTDENQFGNHSHSEVQQSIEKILSATKSEQETPTVSSAEAEASSNVEEADAVVVAPSPTGFTPSKQKVKLSGIEITNEIKTGTFLIAHPQLRSRDFSESIVLITDRSSHSTHGMIVNKPLRRGKNPFVEMMRRRRNEVSEEMEEDEDAEENEDDDTVEIIDEPKTSEVVPLSQVIVKEGSSYLYSNVMNEACRYGGPVSSKGLLWCHTATKKVRGSEQVHPSGVYFGGDISILNEQITNKETQLSEISLYSGTSRWEKGQLEHELKQGSWFLVNIPNAKEFLDSLHNNADVTEVYEECLKQLGGEYAHFVKNKRFPSQIFIQ